jgi:protoporphyrinogen oxidase
MAFDWVEGRVPRPPVADVIKAAVGVETEGYTHQLNFGYPKSGGIEALPRAFKRDCKNITTGFRVEKVWPEGAHWHVTDGVGVKTYDRIVSTIPVEDLINGLPNVPAPVLTAVQGLRYNSLTTVMIGAATQSPAPYTALYVPDMRLPFHRLSFSLNFTTEGAPAGHEGIAAEITTNPGDGFHELDDQEVVRRVVDGLKMMGLLTRESINFQRVYRTKHAYVVRTFDYDKKLSLVLDFLNGLGIISVGRNAEFEYINMDEAIRRGLKAAAALDEG